jgi:hypothetical protein
MPDAFELATLSPDLPLAQKGTRTRLSGAGPTRHDGRRSRRTASYVIGGLRDPRVPVNERDLTEAADALVGVTLSTH